MPFLDEIGLQTFWNNCKAVFANKLGISSNETKVNITIKTKDNEVLSTGSIPAATSSAAGIMSSEDKAKLNGIETGATANVGTITEVKTTSPLAGSGTSGSVTISHRTSTISGGTYGTTATTQVNPAFGGTFEVPGFQIDNYGHAVAGGVHNVKIPNSVASTSSPGLMSAADKTKLDGVEEGATANKGTIEGITSTSPIVGSGTSGTVNISHANIGTAGTYGKTATTALTPAFGATFDVPGFTTDAKGHVSAAGNHTVKMPNTEASASASGLMASGDKSKLDKYPEIDETSKTHFLRRDGSWQVVKRFGTCSTAAGTAAKVVSCEDFALVAGITITVKFSNTNTAANPTLNVQSTGAKAIYYRGAAISAGYLAAKRVYTFVYDGTNYELIGDIDTVRSPATAAPLNVATTAVVGTSVKYAREDHVHALNLDVSKITIGSASSGTAIAADDITSWNAGTLPTLGTAIPADDITAWNAGTAASSSVSRGVLTLNDGTKPSLTYTAKSIPNVTGVGTLPALAYTARSIPNISVTNQSVVNNVVVGE